MKKFKASLIARGLSQKEGTNYNEIFAPDAKLNSIRAQFAIVVQEGMEIHQVDATTGPQHFSIQH